MTRVSRKQLLDESAFQAEIPLLVMSGESVTLGADPELSIEPQWYGGVSPGGADKFVSSFTKWSAQVPSAPTLYQSIIRAGEMAQRAPQGPVYLDVALEHMLEEWLPNKELQKVPLPSQTQAVPEELEKLAAEIIETGKALAKVDALVELSQQLGE